MIIGNQAVSGELKSEEWRAAADLPQTSRFCSCPCPEFG